MADINMYTPTSIHIQHNWSIVCHKQRFYYYIYVCVRLYAYILYFSHHTVVPPNGGPLCSTAMTSINVMHIKCPQWLTETKPVRTKRLISILKSMGRAFGSVYTECVESSISCLPTSRQISVHNAKVGRLHMHIYVYVGI